MFLFFDKFCDIFEETEAMSLYVTGESFGGRYVPNIADNFIFQNNRTLATVVITWTTLSNWRY
ncbi:hypothetical protein BJ742DRAFT_834753 [Cladochytrium replicatum]|nr:hypothetical protein BJ742DRAFT_834753 [Cladochytrium replicatum]